MYAPDSLKEVITNYHKESAALHGTNDGAHVAPVGAPGMAGSSTTSSGAPLPFAAAGTGTAQMSTPNQTNVVMTQM